MDFQKLVWSSLVTSMGDKVTNNCNEAKQAMPDEFVHLKAYTEAYDKPTPICNCSFRLFRLQNRSGMIRHNIPKCSEMRLLNTWHLFRHLRCVQTWQGLSQYGWNRFSPPPSFTGPLPVQFMHMHVRMSVSVFDSASVSVLEEWVSASVLPSVLASVPQLVSVLVSVCQCCC